jgi:hypothetical protein
MLYRVYSAQKIREFYATCSDHIRPIKPAHISSSHVNISLEKSKEKKRTK